MTATTRSGKATRGDADQSKKRPYREFANGSLVGRFRVGREIGRGGYAVVYEGRDSWLARSVALKSIAAPRRRMAVSAAWREAQLLARIHDAHVVGVFDFLREADADVLVLELVSGPPLDQVGRPLPPADVAVLGAQLARGLAAIHAAGVVHGDIKPSNLRLGIGGCLKILDLGVAHSSSSRAVADVIAGTVPYMSPEQLRGHSGDVRSDVWSAGAVLFELATGKRVVDTMSADDRERFVRDGRFPARWVPPRDLAAPLASVIADALAPAPADRIQTARQLLDALTDVPGALARTVQPLAPFRGILGHREWSRLASSADRLLQPSPA